MKILEKIYFKILQKNNMLVGQQPINCKYFKYNKISPPKSSCNYHKKNIVIPNELLPYLNEWLCDGCTYYRYSYSFLKNQIKYLLKIKKNRLIYLIKNIFRHVNTAESNLRR